MPDDKTGGASMVPQAPVYEFIGNVQAPDVFADGASGFHLFQSNVRVTLETVRASHVKGEENKSVRVVIGRLVMPVQGAQALAIGLFDFLKRHGIDVPGVQPGERVQ
ncbi:hypothetical protein [Reyranella sp. CPCC 100927]|uniref:hypothetical protein n=1 Tax=Reyranella sp. CPCC 100927 TaxID=2599616 RepID=UPI0011B3FCBB|nr:hypothetical protein [Reyranella sp. CPCC 100927]TWT11713.1 hypothetical protein FQU96_14660 [Reyranella sp. CPCC 100927]